MVKRRTHIPWAGGELAAWPCELMPGQPWAEAKNVEVMGLLGPREEAVQNQLILIQKDVWETLVWGKKNR